MNILFILNILYILFSRDFLLIPFLEMKFILQSIAKLFQFKDDFSMILMLQIFHLYLIFFGY